MLGNTVVDWRDGELIVADMMNRPILRTDNMVWRMPNSVMERHNGRRKCGIKKRSNPKTLKKYSEREEKSVAGALGTARNGE